LAGENKASEPWSVKLLPGRIDGFKFDHSPLKVASKWLTPSDRLENPALKPTDAQRHIIELGRSSIARHGTADAALQALTAAFNKHRTLRRTAWEKLLQGPHDPRTIQNGFKICCAHSYLVSVAQQRLGISEAAHVMSEGVDQLAKLLSLKEFLSSLSIVEYMYPFQRLSSHHNCLVHLLIQVPLRGVHQFGYSFLVLHEELRICFKELEVIQEVIYSTSEFIRRYALAKYRSFTATQAIRASVGSLLKQVNIRDFEFLSSKTQKAVQTFERALNDCKSFCYQASEFLLLIELRKRARSHDPQQNIYNALHHHFKLFRGEQTNAIASSKSKIRKLRRKNLWHQGRRSRKAVEVSDALARLEHDLHVIMRIYHDSVMPLLGTRIQTMSSCELARQGRIAQKYWLACFQRNDESASRLRELDSIHERALKAIAARYALSHSRLRSIQGDMARLSEIHASYRRPSEPCINLPLDVSPPNEDPTTDEGSDVSQTGKTVLWQPARRAIEETSRPVSAALAQFGQSTPSGATNSRIDPRRDGKLAFSGAHTGSNGRQTPDLIGSAVVSQVMRSGGTVSKCSASNPKTLLNGEGGEDPVLRDFTSFQSTHTTERLLTEHQTIEAVMKALEEGYEKVVPSRIRGDGIYHMQLLNRCTALGDLIAFYHAQKVQLASIAYYRAQGFAKPVASQQLLNCASKLAFEQQMRAFQRQLDSLRWITHISRPSSPLQALRRFSPQISVLYRDLSALVDDLSYSRAFLALEDGFKKRYATTKYELETLIRKTLKGNTDIKGLIIRRPLCLYPPIHLHMHDQLGISRYTLEALIDIRMRRVSLDDYQQGIFGHLDRQFRLFELKSTQVVQEMRIFSGSSFKSHFQEIESVSSAISSQYHEDIQALSERHITLMSPQMLERYSRLAQRFWSMRVTQFTPEIAWEAGTPGEIGWYRVKSCISKGRRSFAVARKTKRESGQALQLSAKDRELQEQAIKAMQRLEEFWPSQPPMSEQAFRKILELEDPSTMTSRVQSWASRLLSGLEEAKLDSGPGPNHQTVILTPSCSQSATSSQL
jgi:hypothetical protein